MKWFARSPRGIFELAEHRVAPVGVDTVASHLRDAGFDPLAYREAHPDLQAALKDDASALAHFIAYCGRDRRSFPVEIDEAGLRRIADLKMPRATRANIIMALVNAYVVPWGGLWRRSAEDQRCFWHAAMAAGSAVGEPVVVIGDSHANGYVQLVTRRLKPIIPFLVLCTGCSAGGLANPNARSGAGQRLTTLAECLPDRSPVYFKFGQVDVEFVFNFNRIRDGDHHFSLPAFEAFCAGATERYIAFVAANFGSKQTTVLSIFPPTLSDAEWRKGYMNAQIVSIEADQELDAIVEGIRQLEIPPLAERTLQHALFNRCLAERVKSANLRFLSDFEPFLSSSGEVDRKFTPMAQGADHHLELEPIGPILQRLIARDRSHWRR